MAQSAQAGGGAGRLDGFVLEDQVGFLIRRAYQRYAALFLDRMAEFDLTPTQFAALVKTIEHKRVTQNLLGRLTATDPATIQGVVRRLVERGLVGRELDPMDRRTTVLVASPRGVELAASAVTSARTVMEAALAPLGENERDLLLGLLRKLG